MACVPLSGIARNEHSCSNQKVEPHSNVPNIWYFDQSTDGEEYSTEDKVKNEHDWVKDSQRNTEPEFVEEGGKEENCYLGDFQTFFSSDQL